MNATTQTEIAVPYTHLRDTFAYMATKHEKEGSNPSSRSSQRAMLGMCETDDDVLELLDYLLVDLALHPAHIELDIRRWSERTYRYVLHTLIQAGQDRRAQEARQKEAERTLEKAAKPRKGELQFLAPAFASQEVFA